MRQARQADDRRLPQALQGQPLPDYHCQRAGIATGTPPCQTIHGAGIDAAVATLVLEQLTPLAVEAALAVSTELAQRAADADRIRQMGLQPAEHAAEAARRRCLAVDPTNQLVADQLEADWMCPIPGRLPLPPPPRNALQINRTQEVVGSSPASTSIDDHNPQLYITTRAHH